MAFRIIRNDITKVAADVIVNSANPKPVCGGSTEAIIYNAAGYDDLLEARQGVGYLEVGQVGVTPAFKLMAKSIVHVSCPWWNDGANESVEMLRQCYVSILQQAAALEAKSIAVPLLSSGVYRFPKEVALQIASDVCGSYSDTEMEILLVVYDLEAFKKAQEFFGNVEDLLKEDVLAEEEFDSFHNEAILADGVSAICRNYSIVNEDLEDTRALAAPRIPEAPRVPGKRSDGCSKPVSDIFGGFAKSRIPKPKPFEKQDSLYMEIDAAIMGIGKPVDGDATFQEKLEEYISRSDMKPADIYRAANLDKRLFSKIRKSDSRSPKKSTVLALSVGLRLNISEIEDFLKRAGYALSPASKSDVIFRCCIEHDGFYKCKHAVWEPIQKLNDILRKYQEDSLGAALSDDD